MKKIKMSKTKNLKLSNFVMKLGMVSTVAGTIGASIGFSKTESNKESIIAHDLDTVLQANTNTAKVLPNDNQLSKLGITTVAEDGSDGFYVGGKNGLFEHFDANGDLLSLNKPKDKITFDINAIALDNKGGVIISGSNAAQVHIDVNGNVLKNFNLNNIFKTQGGISNSLTSKDGKVYIAGTHGLVSVFDQNGDELKTINLGQDSKIKVMIETKDSIILGSEQGNVFFINKISNGISSIKVNSPVVAIQENGGGVFVQTESKSLEISKNQEVLNSVNLDVFKNATITNLVSTKDGYIATGTKGNVALLDKSFKVVSTSIALKGKSINAIVKDNASGFYIAGQNGLVSHIDAKGVENSKEMKTLLDGSDIYGMQRNDQGHIFVFGNSFKVEELDNQGKTIKHFNLLGLSSINTATTKADGEIIFGGEVKSTKVWDTRIQGDVVSESPNLSKPDKDRLVQRMVRGVFKQDTSKFPSEVIKNKYGSATPTFNQDGYTVTFKANDENGTITYLANDGSATYTDVPGVITNKYLSYESIKNKINDAKTASLVLKAYNGFSFNDFTQDTFNDPANVANQVKTIHYEMPYDYQLDLTVSLEATADDTITYKVTSFKLFHDKKEIPNAQTSTLLKTMTVAPTQITGTVQITPNFISTDEYLEQQILSKFKADPTMLPSQAISDKNGAAFGTQQSDYSMDIGDYHIQYSLLSGDETGRIHWKATNTIIGLNKEGNLEGFFSFEKIASIPTLKEDARKILVNLGEFKFAKDSFNDPSNDANLKQTIHYDVGNDYTLDLDVTLDAFSNTQISYRPTDFELYYKGQEVSGAQSSPSFIKCIGIGTAQQFDVPAKFLDVDEETKQIVADDFNPDTTKLPSEVITEKNNGIQTRRWIHEVKDDHVEYTANDEDGTIHWKSIKDSGTINEGEIDGFLSFDAIRKLPTDDEIGSKLLDSLKSFDFYKTITLDINKDYTLDLTASFTAGVTNQMEYKIEDYDIKYKGVSVKYTKDSPVLQTFIGMDGYITIPDDSKDIISFEESLLDSNVVDPVDSLKFVKANSPTTKDLAYSFTSVGEKSFVNIFAKDAVIPENTKVVVQWLKPLPNPNGGSAVDPVSHDALFGYQVYTGKDADGKDTWLTVAKVQNGLIIWTVPNYNELPNSWVDPSVISNLQTCDRLRFRLHTVTKEGSTPMNVFQWSDDTYHDMSQLIYTGNEDTKLDKDDFGVLVEGFNITPNTKNEDAHLSFVPTGKNVRPFEYNAAVENSIMPTSLEKWMWHYTVYNKDHKTIVGEYDGEVDHSVLENGMIIKMEIVPTLAEDTIDKAFNNEFEETTVSGLKHEIDLSDLILKNNFFKIAGEVSGEARLVQQDLPAATDEYKYIYQVFKKGKDGKDVAVTKQTESLPINLSNGEIVRVTTVETSPSADTITNDPSIDVKVAGLSEHWFTWKTALVIGGVFTLGIFSASYVLAKMLKKKKAK